MEVRKHGICHSTKVKVVSMGTHQVIIGNVSKVKFIGSVYDRSKAFLQLLIERPRVWKSCGGLAVRTA